MPDQNWDDIEGIFLGAADLHPDMQQAYLDKVCGHDPEVRRRVESMLHADVDGCISIVRAIQNAAAAVLRDDHGKDPPT